MLLEAFGELAAVACRNASLNAGLVLAARTDGLTGCLNHAALHDGLRRELERIAREPGTRVSLVLFDLDHFKQVNEEHGALTAATPPSPSRPCRGLRPAGPTRARPTSACASALASSPSPMRLAPGSRR